MKQAFERKLPKTSNSLEWLHTSGSICGRYLLDTDNLIPASEIKLNRSVAV